MASAYTWRVKTVDHPGSSVEEIEKEPQWATGHQHRVGYKGPEGRVPGLTHSEDEWTEEDERTLRAWEKIHKLRDRAKRGDLINFRDIVLNVEDFHLRKPENRSLGWRFVLQVTEDWVKNKEDWPANIRKRQKEKEEEEKRKQQEKEKEKHNRQDDEPKLEHEWQREKGEGGGMHHDAYARPGSRGKDEADEDEDERKPDETEYQRLLKRYTPQEIALLWSLEHEKEYIAQLEQNDGKRKCPQTKNRSQISIDEADQFTPDNWIPRSPDLLRMTGKHPLNAQADLTRLFEGGLITPNELHYVRSHGSVPRILWEYHEINIQGGMLRLSMDDLKKFDSINIPVLLACDGNRRKELNMIKRTKGFNFGAGAVSCSYWKGPLVRDVLLEAGVPDKMPGQGKRRYWVHFQGADELSEGKYATSLPFEYVMDRRNDVILAYEMNDLPLPPDHGYPVRLIIPGFVGGRCIKWLSDIWISGQESTSHYHIYDNRVLPSFITERDSEFAHAMFNHPDTACNEQNLNSIIVKPAQGEKISVAESRKDRTYRIKGFAYNGGGHAVQQVEVSLDDGESWLYCIRKFPDAPIRHGNKFWTWVFWHVDVAISHLLRAKSITVRCFDVFKNTQPKVPQWNLLGMMNNCWYVVKPEIVTEEDSDMPSIMFRHPVEPGTGEEGWMKPSVENRIAAAKQEAGTSQKQFTRAEIEKHDKSNDCWIVVDEKVYDATSVLSWHPGGKESIMGHAGKVHQETTDDFASIHDDFAYQKLKECCIGIVTEKAKNYIRQNAKKAAEERAKSQKFPDTTALQKHRWVPVRLLDRKHDSPDTRTYTFELPGDKAILGLSTCQHMEIGFHLKDRMLIRQYTPTRPLLPALDPSEASKPDKAKMTEDARKALRDGNGTFCLTIKTYFPTDDQPGGAMSNILDCVPIGEEVEIRGPTGDIIYNGNGNFVICGKERHFDRVSLILGGSGITPGYALISRVLLDDGDKTEIRVVDGNKTEPDILLRDELNEFEKNSNGQLKVTHVLSNPDDRWEGLKGFVTEDMIREHLFPPAANSVALMCGPPMMIKKAVLPALEDLGYVADENMFGF